MFSRSVVLTAVVPIALGVCRGPTDPALFEQDNFAPGALANYSMYSDDGNPWSLVPGTLQGNGFGLHAVLIRNDGPMHDGWVEVVADSIDDGGIVLRFSDNDHYYLLALRDDQAAFPRGRDNLEIYRRGGSGQAGFVSLWRMDVNWPRGVLHDVRFEAKGDSLRVYFDEERVGAIADPAELSGRRWGVRHYGPSAGWISRYHRLRWHSHN
jgi:hypothetical protein